MKFQEALSLKCDSNCTDRQSQTVIENKPLYFMVTTGNPLLYNDV